MPEIYIDEASGADAPGPGRGTIDQPYQSLAFALFSTPDPDGADTKYLYRKDPGAAYDEPTKSAAKKAKKDAQGLEKKRLRAAAEQREEQEKREKRALKLEESRKVVLVEDAGLPVAVKAKIVNLTPLRDQRVRVSGWVHRLRDQQDIMFIVLRDGTGYLQAILTGNTVRP
ncbi:hypothetical protein BV22DRAFT_985151, partial [Leucogyrophana mollusca]